uniref:WD_REPEATS_REGION domain-containing protein n=1 Tax=Macrostomum lignano TaxID=282301 RepID=A0A1I8H8R1_9PLAT
MSFLGLHKTEARRASSASCRYARRSAIVKLQTPSSIAAESRRKCASVGPGEWQPQELGGSQKPSYQSAGQTQHHDDDSSIKDASFSRPRRPIRSASVLATSPAGPSKAVPPTPQRSMSVLPPGSRRPSIDSVGAASRSARPAGLDFSDGMTRSGRIDERDELTGSECDDGDDVFAPIDERVQTIDFSRMRTQSIQITKNELRKKKDTLAVIKKQVKHFFHENRTGPETDEQGNVELPMNPFVQSREDHDSGLLPSQRLFRLARHEQQELRDRHLKHKQPNGRHRVRSESVDDYEFAWIVKRVSKSPAAAASSSAVSVGHDKPGDAQAEANMVETGNKPTEGNTHASKIGSDTVDFQERVNMFLQVKKPSSLGVHSECLDDLEQAKTRRAQLLFLNGLVESPPTDALSPEEREILQSRLLDRNGSSVDLEDGGRFPCDCCGSAGSLDVDTSQSAARYYDLLFAHRKNDSFTVRFDLVHCLPRFLLHYKFHKQLYDCLDAEERQDLVKAATDITTSYNLGHCTLQVPHGKYRTNAYPAFFAYIIVPDHTKYLEIFEVCNPPVKPGVRQKKSSCAIPNWPDKSYVTEFWTYSKESSSSSDKDPRLTMKLYEKNVLRRLQLVKMPELLVTRRNPPSEVAKRKPAKQLRGEFDLFEDFVLIPHQEQPMLGFGSLEHPKHALESRSPEPDIKFLDRLLQAMNSYVRQHLNTRQRRLDGREDLSCTVNLSLHHSYAFKGHQRVYGFIGFPPASTYWAALVQEQRKNAALAETAVTQEDIRLMRVPAVKPDRVKEEGSSKTEEEVTFADVKESPEDFMDAVLARLNGCRMQ